MAATSFHQQIAANRRNSFLLAGAVVVLLGALGFTAGWALFGEPSGGLLAFGLALTFGVIVGLGTYFAGDAFVLAVSQAHEVDETSAPQLHNVVRELSIAANVPMPKVYLIDDTAPNAFATGRDPRHASVAITTGLLQKLDREELQGVIGHEMSHIGNLDIRFTLLVGVMVGAIALLADWFLRITYWGGGRRSDNDRGGGGGAMALIFVLALLLAIVAPLIGRLVQAAVSRTRESLADATSVELTRNPVGLARALRKISDDTEVLEVANRATQHLYFENPIKKHEQRSSNLFSTHPPVLERINRLRSLSGQPPARSLEDLLGPPVSPLVGARLEHR